MAGNVTTRVIFDYTPRVMSAITEGGLEKILTACGLVIEGYAKINVEKTFSGKSLGTLGNSIQTVTVEKGRQKCRVHVGPYAKHARIQELGGVIRPVHAKALSWVDDSGNRIFARAVHLPARPYLRPAADDHIGDIRDAAMYQIQDVIGGAIP